MSSVHGFHTTDLSLSEGDPLSTILVTLDIKGNTLVEPGSTQITTFNFSIACLDSSNSDGFQAAGESYGRNFSMVVHCFSVQYVAVAGI